jgi:hypothetical protein
MRTTSRPLGPDDVGSVEATVDENGRVAGVAPYPRPTRRRVPHWPPWPRFCRSCVPAPPSSTAADRRRPRPAEPVHRARSMAEAKR